MSERSLLVRRQSHRQRPGEARQAEHDVPLGQIIAERTLPHGATNQGFHEPGRTDTEVGPVRFLQKRMENVHRANAVIQGHVHILAKRVDAVGNGFDQGLSGTDALFQHMPRGGME